MFKRWLVHFIKCTPFQFYPTVLQHFLLYDSVVNPTKLISFNNFWKLFVTKENKYLLLKVVSMLKTNAWKSCFLFRWPMFWPKNCQLRVSVKKRWKLAQNIRMKVLTIALILPSLKKWDDCLDAFCRSWGMLKTTLIYKCIYLIGLSFWWVELAWVKLFILLHLGLQFVCDPFVGLINVQETLDSGISTSTFSKNSSVKSQLHLHSTECYPPPCRIA